MKLQTILYFALFAVLVIACVRGDEGEEDKSKEDVTKKPDKGKKGGKTTEKPKNDEEEKKDDDDDNKDDYDDTKDGGDEEVESTTKKGGKKDKKDFKVDGQYQMLTDPDNDEYGDYLKAMNFSETSTNNIRKTKKVLVTITRHNKTCFTIKTLTKGKTREMKFKSGQKFQTRLADGRKVNNTITVNDEAKSGMRVIKMKGFEATNEAIFWKGGFNVTFKAKEAEAMLSFKRLKQQNNVQKFIEDFASKFFGGGEGSG